MTSSEEIRRRVLASEEQRIERRAEAATKVATAHTEREEARQRLEEAERQLASAVSEAERDMTRPELATFLGARTRDVNEWAAAGTRRRRSTSGKRSRSASASPSTQNTSETTETPSTEASTEHAEHEQSASFS